MFRLHKIMFNPFFVALITLCPMITSAQMDTIRLKEVEIVDQTTMISPVDVIRLQLPESEPIRDIGDFLRTEPNISGIRKGGIAIDPVIRGFKYNQVSVILNEGIKIEGGCPNRMDPVASHVEPEEIVSIEVVKGPYLLKYGPVFGALMILKTTQPEPPEKRPVSAQGIYGFETNWNGQREHVAVQGGGKRFYARASGGFKGYGSYRAGNNEFFNTSFRKRYLTIGAGAKLTSSCNLKISYRYDNGINVLFPALPMDEVSDNTHVGSVLLTGNPGRKRLQRYQVLGYYSFVHHIMDNLFRPSAKTMEAVTTVDALNTGGKAETIWSFGNKRVTFGTDFEHIYKNGEKVMTMYMDMGGVIYKSIKHFNVFNHTRWNNAGIYGEFIWPMGKWRLIAAGRLDLNQATSRDTFRLESEGVTYFGDPNSLFINYSMSVGINYAFTRFWSFQVAAGRGTRSPSLLERYIKLMPVQYDSYDYLGNPQLRPEKNHQVDLSLTYAHPSIGIFSIDGFGAVVTDYISGTLLPPSVIKPSTQGAPGVKQFNNLSCVYLTGFEFSYSSPPDYHWGLHVTCSYTQGTSPSDIQYIVEEGQVVDEVTINQDPLAEIPPLEGSIYFSYKFWKNRLIPRLSCRFVNAQNRISKAYNEETTPGFMVAGLSVTGKPFHFLSLSAGIDNLFDASYSEHLNRRIIGSTEKLMEPGRVFFFSVAVNI